MRIYSNFQSLNFYQYERSTSQTRTSSTLTNTSNSTMSNPAAILELSENEHMEMEDYPSYSVNSIRTTYTNATVASLPPYEVYNSWFEGLGALADQKLNDSYAAIEAQKGKAEGLTEEFMKQLEDEQLAWFLQQRVNLYTQLTTQSSMSQDEWDFYNQEALDILGNMDQDMLDAIHQYKGTGQQADISYSGALTAYRNYEQSLGNKIADYIGKKQQEISNSASTITNNDIEEYLNQFNEWKTGLMNSFKLDIENARTPLHTSSLLQGNMQNIFDIVMPDIWNSISNTIQQKNSDIENANRRRQQAAEAEQLNKLKIDYKTGSDTNEISISTSKPPSSKYSTKFVVEGSAGKNKDIYISFSDERMKKEFDKRIKAAGLEGKKLSAKEFNEILKELKSSLKELGEIDLDALLRKMEKGEKDLDFEHSMNRFILYLKRAVKA